MNNIIENIKRVAIEHVPKHIDLELLFKSNNMRYNKM